MINPVCSWIKISIYIFQKWFWLIVCEKPWENHKMLPLIQIWDSYLNWENYNFDDWNEWDIHFLMNKQTFIIANVSAAMEV